MKVFKILFLIFTSLCYLQANSDISPYYHMDINNNAISSAIYNNTLYITSDKGTVELYDLDSKKNIETIVFEPISAGFELDKTPPRVSHIDIYKDGKKLLFVTDDIRGSKALFIYEDKKLKKIFSSEDRLNISKVYFVDDERIIVGLLGNEIILYDTKTNKELYRVQPYWSMLTDFKLNEDRSLAFIGAESGVVYILNVTDGSGYKNYELHGDIILNMDIKNEMLISGGADKNVFVLDIKNGNHYSFASSFLVNAVSLNNDGKIGAYVANEDNDIIVFNTDTKEVIATLKDGQKYVNINNIIFLDNNEILVSYNNKKVLKWRFK